MTKRSDEVRICFNVSGQRFETFEKTLQRFPDTLLGDDSKRHLHYNKSTKQYFFNRNIHAFEAILFFFQSNGKLLRPYNVHPELFDMECEFFVLPKHSITEMRIKEGRELIHQLKKLNYIKPNSNEHLTIRQLIWHTMENPRSSNVGTCIFLLQMVTILASLFLNTLETVPDIKKNDSSTLLGNPWLTTEILLSCWFFLEFIFRLTCAPDLIKFSRNVLNLVDLFAIPPYLCLKVYTYNKKFLFILQTFRFFRVLRVFRVIKFSKQLKGISLILQDGLRDFQLFIVCLFIIVFFGGSVMYFIERDLPAAHFQSVPDSMWWGIQTFLTVGYGDISPKTLHGKLFSSFFMVLGIITMSLPVLSLIMKFVEYTKC